MIVGVAGAEDFAAEVQGLCERLQVGLDEVFESHAGHPKADVKAALAANPVVAELDPAPDVIAQWAALISAGARVEVTTRRSQR
jgi:hypothetical protein